MAEAPTWRTEARRILGITLGVLLMVVSYNGFFISNSIAPGGFTGLATVLHSLMGWPVGALVILFNIPLFVLGFKHMGLKHFITSIVCMVGFSLLLDVVPRFSLMGEADLLLASVYGGLLLGVGLGLVLLNGGSTGGSDLAAQLLSVLFPTLKVAWLLLAIDAFVVLVAGIAFGPQLSLYALISIAISSRIVDMMQEGSSSAKAFFIITAMPESISRRVIEEMNRGVTALRGAGMYSGADKHVLFCVVYRAQLGQLKRIIAEEDPAAFVVVNDVREAMGKGFRSSLAAKKPAPAGKNQV